MPEGGVLTIRTRNIAAEEAARLTETSAGQECVLLEVADTGLGMSEDIKARAFEPFFTAKPVGQGSGLGLSQVHGFVTQSGGQVAIDSALGQGTTVRLYLPRAA
jgi:signal transduction histidine kinase